MEQSPRSFKISASWPNLMWATTSSQDCSLKLYSTFQSSFILISGSTALPVIFRGNFSPSAWMRCLSTATRSSASFLKILVNLLCQWWCLPTTTSQGWSQPALATCPQLWMRSSCSITHYQGPCLKKLAYWIRWQCLMSVSMISVVQFHQAYQTWQAWRNSMLAATTSLELWLRISAICQIWRASMCLIICSPRLVTNVITLQLVGSWLTQEGIAFQGLLHRDQARLAMLLHKFLQLLQDILLLFMLLQLLSIPPLSSHLHQCYHLQFILLHLPSILLLLPLTIHHLSSHLHQCYHLQLIHHLLLPH